MRTALLIAIKEGVERTRASVEGRQATAGLEGAMRFGSSTRSIGECELIAESVIWTEFGETKGPLGAS